MGYKSPRTYTICGQTTALAAPVDATTYYGGGVSQAFGTSAATRKIFIPISGHIRSVQIHSQSTAVAGTGEDWLMSLYDGTTDTTIATVGSVDPRTWVNNNFNYRVTAGGYVQFKTTTPTWVTNPEGFLTDYTIIIEYE